MTTATFTITSLQIGISTAKDNHISSAPFYCSQTKDHQASYQRINNSRDNSYTSVSTHGVLVALGRGSLENKFGHNENFVSGDRMIFLMMIGVPLCTGYNILVLGKFGMQMQKRYAAVAVRSRVRHLSRAHRHKEIRKLEKMRPKSQELMAERGKRRKKRGESEGLPEEKEKKWFNPRY
eukprot:scaffold2121_cov128-Skeletonema_dohrnii-CCMP3373.AAC.6